MKFCGFLKQNTAVEKLIGQLFSFSDGKTLLTEAVGGNEDFDPSLLTCVLSKNTTQSTYILYKDAGDIYVDTYLETPVPDCRGVYRISGTYNGQNIYVKSNGLYYIYYDGAKWILSDAGPGETATYTWEGDTSLFDMPLMAVTPASGGVLAADVLIIGINLVNGGFAKVALSADDTDTEGVLILSLENTQLGNEIIFVDSFYWIVLNETAYNQMFGVTALATAANLTTVDTVVDAIKAKTDNLPASPATEAKQNTIIANQSTIDTHVLSRSSHSAADVKTAIEAAGSHLALIKSETDKITSHIIEVDSYIDKTDPDQWQYVLCKKGDPNTEYARKNMLDENDDPITSTAQVVTKLEEPETE